MTVLGNMDAIVRRPLHDQLVERLQALIVDGELVPGEKVAERELCERFGVSRTPLREALKVLASDGLVSLMPNRGAVVNVLTLSELEEVFPVMGALEALSGELACVHIEDGEVEYIEDLHRRMLQFYDARELTGYFRLNQEIHEAILVAARNGTLMSHYRTLAVRVRRVRYLADMSPESWARAVEEHEMILAALKARDGQRLAGILKDHLQNKFETVREWIEKNQVDRQASK